MTTIATMSPQELDQLCREDGAIDLIDVRTPAEFRTVHVEGARNIPLDRLDCDSVLAARNGRSDQPLYVICQSGNRAKQACEKFLAAGCDQVVNIEGGTKACVEAGLPLVRGKAMMSLERQVRIAAGLLILLGVLLGWQVSEYFYILSGFVGAGLVFAGITDTCGMGMLIAKMPWNRVSEEGGSGESPKCAC
jgi:rhodanese-related sulfurtransferase